jgi:hypothetical protein
MNAPKLIILLLICALIIGGMTVAGLVPPGLMLVPAIAAMLIGAFWFDRLGRRP